MRLPKIPGAPSARYYEALARFQDGDAAGAVAAWRALLADNPADAPWRGMVEERIAAAAPAPPLRLRSRPP